MGLVSTVDKKGCMGRRLESNLSQGEHHPRNRIFYGRQMLSENSQKLRPVNLICNKLCMDDKAFSDFIYFLGAPFKKAHRLKHAEAAKRNQQPISTLDLLFHLLFLRYQLVRIDMQ